VYVVLPSFQPMFTLALPVVCRDRAAHRMPVPTANDPAGIVTLYSAVIDPVPVTAEVGPRMAPAILCGAPTSAAVTVTFPVSGCPLTVVVVATLVVSLGCTWSARA